MSRTIMLELSGRAHLLGACALICALRLSVWSLEISVRGERKAPIRERSSSTELITARVSGPCPAVTLLRPALQRESQLCHRAMPTVGRGLSVILWARQFV